MTLYGDHTMSERELLLTMAADMRREAHLRRNLFRAHLLPHMERQAAVLERAAETAPATPVSAIDGPRLGHCFHEEYCCRCAGRQDGPGDFMVGGNLQCQPDPRAVAEHDAIVRRRFERALGIDP